MRCTCVPGSAAVSDAASAGHLDEVVHAGLEGEVVDLDALRQIGEVGLEHRLDGGVLVLCVPDQQVHDVADVGGEGGTGEALRGSMRPASAVTANSSARMPLWMSL